MPAVDDPIVVKLMGDASGYNSMLSTAMNATQTATGSMLGMFAGFATGLGPLIAGLAGGISIFSLGSWGVNMAMQAEQAQISFETMTGSAEKAKQMMSDIEKFAASTPMETTDLIQSSKTLMQFGTTAENVMPVMKMLGDVTGGDAQRFSMMSLAFGQMSASGRLMGQDLNQMINAGFNPLQQMSKDTGKSIGQLKKEMESGKITTDMVVKAMQNATSAGGQFDGMMQKQSQSLGGLWSTLKDNVALTVREIGFQLINGFDLKGWLQTSIEYVGMFQANFKENIAILKDWVSLRWYQMVYSMKMNFGWLIDGIGDGWAYFSSTALKAVGNVIGFFMNLRENLGIIFEYVGKNWWEILKTMLANYITYGRVMAENATVVIDTLIRLYVAWAGYLKSLFDRTFTYEFVYAVIEGLVEANKAMWDWVIDTGSIILQWAGKYGTIIAKVLSGQWGSAATELLVGITLDDTASTLIQDKANEWMDRMNADFNKGVKDGDFLKSATDIIKQGVNKLKNPINEFVNPFADMPALKTAMDGSFLPQFVFKKGEELGGEAMKGFQFGAQGMGDPMKKEVGKSLELAKSGSAEAMRRLDTLKEAFRKPMAQRSPEEKAAKTLDQIKEGIYKLVEQNLTRAGETDINIMTSNLGAV